MPCQVKLLYHDLVKARSKLLCISVGFHQESSHFLIMDPRRPEHDVVCGWCISKHSTQFIANGSHPITQRSLLLSLYKTEFLTVEPIETGILNVSGSDLLRAKRLKYLWPRWTALWNCFTAHHRNSDELVTEIPMTALSFALYGSDSWKRGFFDGIVMYFACRVWELSSQDWSRSW